MKKILTFIIILMIVFSSLNLSYGSKNLKGKFTENSIPGTKFKQITLTPYYSNTDDENSFYIYLPSGYFVEGSSASYVADKNGRYPFTVYDGSYKKTFIYNVDNIEEATETQENIPVEFSLLYDYEKKLILFNLKSDKYRTISTPENTTVSNELNYYIKDIKNNESYDLNIYIDKKPFKYKIIKSGEFYLLVYISPVNYNDYSTVVEYYGYNFTNNEVYKTKPHKDIYDDNSNYNVLVESENNKHLFNISVDTIDYRRPLINWDIGDSNFSLNVVDDFELSYIITYDGKYINIKGKEAKYIHPEDVIYNGEYIFIAGDKEGNRTVEKAVVKSKRKINTTKTRHTIDLNVHDFKYTDQLFENKGMKYEKEEEKTMFETILPGYMNGKNKESFHPDSPITRAEMVTIFCRLNNLPYDNSAYLKSKFTDINEHWARDYISMGSSKKYVSGYKDKTFKPNNNVTRAEFCQMLTKISAYKTLLNSIPASTNIDYIDIHNHWAEKEIVKIAGRNLIFGNGEYFYPDKAITRGEVVYAVNNLYGFNPTDKELLFMYSLYNKYYGFEDVSNHKYFDNIVISTVGMYKEKMK